MRVAILEGSCPTLMPEGPVVERKILGSGVDIRMGGSLRPKQYAGYLNDIDALIVRSGAEVCREMVLSMKRAKIIAILGVGYDNIPLALARKKGIIVCNVPDYCTREVADATVAMILAHQRKLLFFNHSSKLIKPSWDWRINIPILSAPQTSVGIIGLGRIGKAVMMRLKPFGYKISFYDPYLPKVVGKRYGIGRFNELESLLTSSDIVSIHTPLTKDTHGLIDDRFLRLLKPAAILINTARGKIFRNTQLIYEFLKVRPQLRIGSDVWPDEPPKAHPLFNAWKNREPWLGDRLILCPHTAFYSEESLYNLRVSAAKTVRNFFNGQKPPHIVNQ